MTRTVWAAGAVVWRNGPHGCEIALIHRPRYDDWTLPKGKAERGETLVATALREIAEETGYRVRLARQLSDVTYEITHGRKHVRYWSAQVIGGSFLPNDEVDILRWVPAADASAELSYRLDRRVLREFLALPADLRTVLMVRHAKAGRRARFSGDDRLRPLDAEGRRQAQALADLLLAFGAGEVHSAPRVRCEQTVTPLANALDVDIMVEPTLTEEAYTADQKAARRRVRDLATEDGPIAVICSQGKVIPPLLRWWADRDSARLPSTRNRKASVWVLTVCGKRLVAVDHIDSPFPRKELREE